MKNDERRKGDCNREPEKQIVFYKNKTKYYKCDKIKKYLEITLNVMRYFK